MARKDRDIVSQGLDQIFNSGENDILSNVIQSDQRRTGRSVLLTDAVTNSDAIANTASSAETKKEVDAKSSEVAKKRSSEVAKQEEEDTVESVIFKMLAKPYTIDSAKGPFTVSTMKIPTILSERLTWVASLTGRTKQDIVAEALKDYFAKVSKGKK